MRLSAARLARSRERLAQLTRTVTTKKTGQKSVEIVYLITTLSREQASPRRLLELVRARLLH